MLCSGICQVVNRFPTLLSTCASDLEHLITDSNRNIATLAVTTLLKVQCAAVAASLWVYRTYRPSDL